MPKFKFGDRVTAFSGDDWVVVNPEPDDDDKFIYVVESRHSHLFKRPVDWDGLGLVSKSLGGIQFDGYREQDLNLVKPPETPTKETDVAATPEDAIQKAYESGAIKAYLCGEPLQWRLSQADLWRDLDPGSQPDFTGLAVRWRPKPYVPPVPETPVVKWYNLSDVAPQIDDFCLVSDGSEIYSDTWGVMGDGDTDWYTLCSREGYVYWCPAPNCPETNE